MDEKRQHRKLLKLIAFQNQQINNLYNRLTRDLGEILKHYKKTKTGTTWHRNKEIEKKVDILLAKFRIDIEKIINTNIELSWDLSNDKWDSITNTYLKGIDISESIKASYLLKNVAALDAFKKRVQNGLTLSRRVWNLSENTKRQIETILDSGIMEGTPATSIAADLKKYLKEPEKRFRRIRNSEGKLVLSDPAKNYKPGRGVYRSSFKNALRLSGNEINVANRTADHLRRKALPFVMGFRVNLSPAHPRYDICDELAGDYPNGFVFVGWHTNCLCFTTAILLPRKKFIQYLNSGKINKKYQVRSIPKRAANHLNSISDQIKSWKNTPQFIQDNFKNSKNGFSLKKSVFNEE